MSDHERGDDCRDHGHQAHIDDGEVVWTPHPPANAGERELAEDRLRHADTHARQEARDRVARGDVPGEGRGERGDTDELEDQGGSGAQ